jgi:uncharacterized protein YqhQ
MLFGKMIKRVQMKKIDISRFFGDAAAFSTSKSITFNGPKFVMEVSKNGYDCRSREPKWYDNTYIRISILAIFEINFYVTTGEAIYEDWRIIILFLSLVLLSLFAYTYIFNDSKTLRMNHGAEHKILNAFLNHDLRNVDKYSRFSDNCGGNIFPMAMIFVLISPIIKLPMTVFLIYMIIYNNLKPVKRIVFNTIGKFIQKFTTAEPTKEILDNTKKGFEKLIYIEAGLLDIKETNRD